MAREIRQARTGWGPVEGPASAAGFRTSPGRGGSAKCFFPFLPTALFAPAFVTTLCIFIRSEMDDGPAFGTLGWLKRGGDSAVSQGCIHWSHTTRTSRSGKSSGTAYNLSSLRYAPRCGGRHRAYIDCDYGGSYYGRRKTLRICARHRKSSSRNIRP